MDHYDPGCRYVLIEGLTRANPHTGLLEEMRVNKRGEAYWREVTLGRQRFNWDAYDKYITSLEWAAVKVRRTHDEFQTAHTIASLYHYYQKDWNEHKSLRALYHQPDAHIALEDRENPVRCVAKEFPGIGVEKSLAAAMKWRNIFDMVTSETKDWCALPGVGPVIARKVMNFIHGTE
jgi:ERCC4-type nuclease